MLTARRFAMSCLSLAFVACQGPGAAPPSAQFVSTSAPNSPTSGTTLGLVQEADVTVVAEGQDIHLSVSPDIGYDMYGREVTEEFVPYESGGITYCRTLEAAEDLAQDVRNTPLGTHITCADDEGNGTTDDDRIIPGGLVRETLLLDVIYHVPDTHTYVHFLEVAAPDVVSSNTEVEFN